MFLLLWPGLVAAQVESEWRTVVIETSEVSSPDITVTPGGESLIFTLLGHLFLLSNEGGEAEQLTFGPFFDARPTVSPDGNKVAFQSDRDGSEGNIYVMDLDSREITKLTSDSWADARGWLTNYRDHHYSYDTCFISAPGEGHDEPDEPPPAVGEREKRMRDDTDPNGMLPLTHLSYHVMLAIADAPLHGYGIIKEVAARTGGAMELEAGTLYAAIRRMNDEGLLEDAPDPQDGGDSRRRYYRLTAFGRDVLEAESRRLANLLHVAREKNVIHA